ncbi:MAG: hypothetical protein HAW60_01780, partial [Bdellovibrionales bacterium]|nr:hypothetical protein [Bdellovibrionales bacterium]
MKTVPLNEIFQVKYGVNLELSNIDKHKNGIPFISRTEKNNGLSAKVKLINGIRPNPAHTISVAGGGSVMSSFYQEREYYSGRDLYYLKPIMKLTKRQMHYYCMCLSANKYKYSYGRQANKTLNDLLVPLIENIPSWVNAVKIKQPNKKSAINKKLELNIDAWHYFRVGDLFDVVGSKSFTKTQISAKGVGKYPYVVTSSENNGIQGFYNHYTEDGNILTIDSATIGSCFYQCLEFSASDHVEKLVPNFKLNKYIALFLTTILNLEKY